MVWIFGDGSGDAVSKDDVAFLLYHFTFLGVMAHDQGVSSAGQSLEGQAFTLTNVQERMRVIELAFDYRGDVTITVTSGEVLEGYLFDRDESPANPTIKMFLKGQTDARILEIQQIVSLTFSGEDTAFGKSWDDWVHKKEKVSQKSHAS